MWKSILLAVLLSLVAKCIFNAVMYLDLLKHDVVATHAPGQCIQLENVEGGSEDLTTLPDGRTFISSGFFPDRKAKILLFDFLDPTHAVKEVKLESSIGLKAEGFHGISAWVDPKTSEVTLMVINHRKDGDHVEVFRFNAKGGKLVHIKSITDPLFSNLNDLVAVSDSQFYTTHMFFWHPREVLVYPRTGSIVFYDGSTARTVASGYMLPNGVNASPDKRTVYVAEFGAKRLLVFKRKANNDLEYYKDLFLDGGVDNMEVDPKSGDIWIGSHARIHRTIAYDGKHGHNMQAPSQVFKVRVKNGEFMDVKEVFLDDGKQISASTVAYGYKGRLIIGSLGGPPLLCDLIYF